MRVLDQILETMNILSTSQKGAVDLQNLNEAIDSLLSAPSNMEMQENGRIYIKSFFLIDMSYLFSALY